MCLTAHFIDNEWKLRSKVLAFCPQEDHCGVDIGKTVDKCLQEWEIENILTVSVDNASANDVAIDFLKRVFRNSTKCLLNAKWTHIRCVAHIINLVVQDGVKKVNKSVEKIRWAVWWIRKSPSRIDKFNNFAKLVNANTEKHLLLDVATRWNSTYLMLEVAQSYEKTFERYDIEESVFRTELEKAGHEELKPKDWQSVRDLCHFFKPFFDITKRVSGTHYVTSNSCIDEIYQIRTILDEAIGNETLCQIAMAMNAKFQKILAA
ncbi:putative ribonuclease H-like superfamily [Helianthus annuus]|nr:putative ribonuclease H-like superfamily [Helianthus annuus]